MPRLNRDRLVVIILAVVVLGSYPTFQSRALTQISITRWPEALKQKPEWYGTGEGVRIADNLLAYQRESGGWPKNIDMAKVLSKRERADVIREKGTNDSTIDNNATYTQLTFLARVYRQAQLARHRDAFIKGIDYLFAAQYDNGGWPQYYPLRKGYYQHITFNDDAMIGVMRLLRDVAQRKPEYLFIDEARRSRAERAVEKGIECILRTQVIVQGKRTVWCAQHDEVTMAPAAARTYEPVSLSGLESAGVVRFLMGIEHPDTRVIDAIQSAISWFRAVQISGIRWVATGNPVDRVVIADKNAPLLWARFYEIGTNRPIFSGRDSVIKYSVAEIESERRNGYAWYTEAPAKLLDTEYPAWVKRAAAAKAASK